MGSETVCIVIVVIAVVQVMRGRMLPSLSAHKGAETATMMAAKFYEVEEDWEMIAPLLLLVAAMSAAGTLSKGL